jgi:hypothetical protein
MSDEQLVKNQFEKTIFIQNSRYPHISYAFSPKTFQELNCKETDTSDTILSKYYEMMEKLHIDASKDMDDIICRISIDLYKEEFLDLSCHKIDDETAEVLAYALKENNYIKRVNLYHNNIGDKGAISLSELTLDVLNLCNNNIGIKGCQALSKSKIGCLNLSCNMFEENEVASCFL